MEKEKEVILSGKVRTSLQEIYEYGVETFGQVAADSFMEDVYGRFERLGKGYLFHPECRHLPTQSKIYRNIIIGSYLILYRIRADKVEVLNAYHSSQSVRKVKANRKIKPQF